MNNQELKNEERQALIERIAEICAEYSKPNHSKAFSVKDAEIAELARISLAALTAEPVAWVYSGEISILSRLKQHTAVEVGLFNAQRYRDDIPLFTSPHVPAGWKIVPVEPTEKMVVDGFESAPVKLPEPFNVFKQAGGVDVAVRAEVSKNHLFGIGYNACLEEVMRLNAIDNTTQQYE